MVWWKKNNLFCEKAWSLEGVSSFNWKKNTKSKSAHWKEIMKNSGICFTSPGYQWSLTPGLLLLGFSYKESTDSIGKRKPLKDTIWNNLNGWHRCRPRWALQAHKPSAACPQHHSPGVCTNQSISQPRSCARLVTLTLWFTSKPVASFRDENGRNSLHLWPPNQCYEKCCLENHLEGQASQASGTKCHQTIIQKYIKISIHHHRIHLAGVVSIAARTPWIVQLLASTELSCRKNGRVLPNLLGFLQGTFTNISFDLHTRRKIFTWICWSIFFGDHGKSLMNCHVSLNDSLNCV